MKLPAHRIESGDRIQTGTGLTIKVLCSNAERQSAMSASATVWHIEGYAEGEPTTRILCDPHYELEVIARSGGSLL